MRRDAVRKVPGFPPVARNCRSCKTDYVVGLSSPTVLRVTITGPTCSVCNGGRATATAAEERSFKIWSAVRDQGPVVETREIPSPDEVSIKLEPTAPKVLPRERPAQRGAASTERISERLTAAIGEDAFTAVRQAWRQEHCATLADLAGHLQTVAERVEKGPSGPVRVDIRLDELPAPASALVIYTMMRSYARDQRPPLQAVVESTIAAGLAACGATGRHEQCPAAEALGIPQRRRLDAIEGVARPLLAITAGEPQTLKWSNWPERDYVWVTDPATREQRLMARLAEAEAAVREPAGTAPPEARTEVPESAAVGGAAVAGAAAGGDRTAIRAAAAGEAAVAAAPVVPMEQLQEVAHGADSVPAGPQEFGDGDG
ncbi:hypothetical protein [Asanoa sp. NPDC050611]|uniref:hypothetical protein n=1 Tax=Asanoa sp. NPDC050611 TaxID=3157098 RepID=UPI0033EE4D72